MPSNGFAEHCREIARRFLLTAVVVDDELSVPADTPVHGELTAPRRSARARRRLTSAGPQLHPARPLKVGPITWSFARRGMVCGVVSPQGGGQEDHEALANAVARADIVILDWRLSRSTGADALPLLKRILAEDQAHRLRLIAIYTGESEHEPIRDKIAEALNDLGTPDQAEIASDHDHITINFRACRIVVYAKPDSPTREPSTVVHEEALADRLIADFADMVEGLLPSLVLTALAAVRENVYRVLGRFGPKLDPAFLAHRACLPQPAESEQHIGEQIASELHSIIEDDIIQMSPAGIDAIKLWLRGQFGDNRVEFGQGKDMSQSEVLAMLKHGVEKKRGCLKKDGKDYPILSDGFSRGTQDGRELDRRLASAMSFRQVLADTARQLSMGTVVRRTGSNGVTLLCVTPKCDSVRLVEKSSFLFLPLSDPKSDTLQVVVPPEEGGHRRMTISMNPSSWCMADFEPDPVRQCVLAYRNGPSQAFMFKDAAGREYRWVGELKPEFSQSIAQAIATRTSRVPLNKSEWLRRSQSVGER